MKPGLSRISLLLACALSAPAYAFDCKAARSPIEKTICGDAGLLALGGKIGFDATAKWEGEGYTRGWPEVNRIPADIKARVDERWASFGITMPGHVR